MSWAGSRLRGLAVLWVGFLFAVPAARAQAQLPAPPADSTPAAAPKVDPLHRPLTKKQEKDQRRRLVEDFSQYRKWIDQDVIYIITPEERAAFALLSNDAERDAFIENFWVNRDPTPDTPENEFKEEHYRRIAYANQHFGAGTPGWKTDRGRMYIIHGPPDEIESHPSGGTYDRPLQQGGGTTTTFPFETWRYRFIEDVGQDVVIEFVDSCMCGDFHLTIDPDEKDALAHTPMGQHPNQRPLDNTKPFEDLQRMADMNRPPKVHFPQVNELVRSKVRINVLPFDVLPSFVRVTAGTVLVPIAVQIKHRDITFSGNNGVDRGVLNIFGQVENLSGRVVQSFEDTVQVDVPHDLLAQGAENASVYSKALPLTPGHYRLDVVVKDVNGDRVGSWSHLLVVPQFEEGQLATSSLIVADRMEPIPTKILDSGPFMIGDTYVRPRVPGADGTPATFKRNQKISFWMEIYNLQTDEKTHRSLANVEYDVTSVATGKVVFHTAQSTAQLGSVGDQFTVKKTLAAADLPPGGYTLKIRVNDALSGQQVEPSTTFSVE